MRIDEPAIVPKRRQANFRNQNQPGPKKSHMFVYVVDLFPVGGEPHRSRKEWPAKKVNPSKGCVSLAVAPFGLLVVRLLREIQHLPTDISVHSVSDVL